MKHAQKQPKTQAKKKPFNFSEAQVKDIYKWYSTVVCVKGTERLEKNRFREFLENGYGQKLGYTLTKLLTDQQYFDFRNNQSVTKEDYVQKVEKFINMDRREMKKFVFECYDCFKNNDKITEENLFCFMHIFEKFHDRYEGTI